MGCSGKGRGWRISWGVRSWWDFETMSARVTSHLRLGTHNFIQLWSTKEFCWSIELGVEYFIKKEFVQVRFQVGEVWLLASLGNVFFLYTGKVKISGFRGDSFQRVHSIDSFFTALISSSMGPPPCPLAWNGLAWHLQRWELLFTSSIAWKLLAKKNLKKESYRLILQFLHSF